MSNATDDRNLSESDKFILTVLNRQSVFMKYISSYVDAFVFNSSQSVEGNLITSWNNSKKNPEYFNIYDH